MGRAGLRGGCCSAVPAPAFPSELLFILENPVSFHPFPGWTCVVWGLGVVGSVSGVGCVMEVQVCGCPPPHLYVEVLTPDVVA